MKIPVKEPFDLRLTLQEGQAFRWRCVAGWQTSVLFDNIVKLRKLEDGVLEMRSWPSEPEELHDPVSNYLAIDEDIQKVHEVLEKNEIVGGALRRFPGLRILREDPWECLISYILSANASFSSSAKKIEAIAREFGRAITYDGLSYATFPGVDNLNSAGETALRILGLGFHAKYVAGTAEMVAKGCIDLHALRDARYEDALEELLELPGVGDKVANCVLLFSLDKPTAFPVDLWVRRAIEEWYPDADPQMTNERMRIWAQQRFGEYAGYANQYLFISRRLRDEVSFY